MKVVFSDSQKVEKEAKARYGFPEFIMMENAAAALEQEIYSFSPELNVRILVLCGSGNNGGDGYALARRLSGKTDCDIFALKAPKTEEAIIQRKMAEAADIQIYEDFPADEKLSSYDVIVDCILGTGFTGELRDDIAEILKKVNALDAYKIACDIPTGLKLNADVTVTMGCLKTALFSDAAKAVCGKIIVADLGIARPRFEACGEPDAFLLEASDVKLPLRKNKAAHKGTYGHTAVFAGEKSGAGILAAIAALNFGSGLVSLVPSEKSNLSQFKISPQLMISDSIPANTTCVLVGSGLGKSDAAMLSVKEWFSKAKNPACVFDADLFSWKDFPSYLTELCNLRPDGKIILTPHLKELKTFCDSVFSDEEMFSIAELTQAGKRIETGKKLCKHFPNVTVIMKSADTFIASEGKSFICTNGCQSLAKAGSGDVLAGMTAALLAQGYTASDAAITAVYTHAAASSNFSDGEGFDLTAEKLILQLSAFSSAR